MARGINYKVNPSKMQEDLYRLGMIGKSGRGVTRLAYTPAEDRAHEYIRERMERLGMAIRTDGAGNLYGTLNIRHRRTVIGSHLDSVPEGGNYDGTLGVVIGLEAARAIKEAGVKTSLEVVAFRAEESTRFHTSCIGSKLATGFLTPEEAARLIDKDKTSLYDAIKKSGFNPDNLEPWDKSGVKLYIEPHIEQGRVLLEAGAPIGIVTAIAAPVRYAITLIGKQDHSGATPMHMRKDALAAFSEMHTTLEALAIGAESKGGGIRATIGYVDVHAGSINKIAGTVVFPIDLRATELNERDTFEGNMRQQLSGIAKTRGISIIFGCDDERGTPVKLKEEDYSILELAAQGLGIRAPRLVSGAGHDAQYVALFGIPTAMLFVQSSGGSHNPDESADMANVETATNLLISAMMEANK